jgi:hypothetical protein
VKTYAWMLMGMVTLLGGVAAARADDYFTYWTELQMVNLTPYDVKITKLKWEYLVDDKAHAKVGDVIPKADPDNPQQEPFMIGKVSRWSGGVDLEVWFKLLGNEGSEDCYLKIHNPYTGDNTITPGKTFPTSQCPSAAPADIPDSQPAPLYHNIELPSSGHKLELVALLAFQQLIPDDAGMSAQDQQKAAQESKQQIDQSEIDKQKFRQETGIPLP